MSHALDMREHDPEPIRHKAACKTTAGGRKVGRTARYFSRCLLATVLSEMKITRRELARESGLYASQVNAICLDYHSPTVAVALVICDALERITGSAFDIGQLWVIAGSKPVKGKRVRLRAAA